MTRLLTRLFFDALFDLGFLSREGADGFIRVVIGIVAIIITLGLWLTRMYTIVYAPGAGILDPTPYISALSANTMTALGLPMWIAAFVTVLVSQSVVPDETDYRVLMALPITQGFIFRAEFPSRERRRVLGDWRRRLPFQRSDDRRGQRPDHDPRAARTRARRGGDSEDRD